MSNLAAFRFIGSVGGSSPSTDRGYDLTAGEILQVQLEASASLVSRATFQVYDAGDPDSPLATLGAPTLTLDNGTTTGQAVDAAPLPNSAVDVTGHPGVLTAGHSWKVRCTVDGGINPATGKADPDRVFERVLALRAPSTNRLIVPGEGTEYSDRSWMDSLNEAMGGLPTSVPPGTVVDQTLKWSGAAWLAGALNLAAAAAVTGILAVANGGTGLAAIGAANTVAKVNGAGTLLEYGKLVSANLDAAAGIVGTQLAAGANILGSQLSAAAGIVGTQLSATAAIAATQLAAGAAGTVLIGGASNSFSAAPTVTSLAASSYLAAGGTVATAGALRLAHGGSVQGRDNANAADRVVASWGVVATDVVNVGDANVVTRITGSALHAYVGATQVAQLGVAAGDFVAVGANPAATGGIRLGNAVAIYARNAANSANIQLCVINASNNVVFGDTANNGIFFDSGSGTSINLRPGGANGIALSGSACNVYISGALLMQFGSAAAIWDQGVASPVSYQARRSGDNAAYDWQIRAQSASATGTGANVHGGHLLLRGGAEKGAAAGKKGGVRLQLNATTETMLEATEVAVGRRVVALCRGSDVTTTQMPSGTGDRVVYIENCATARSTGTPVGGGMLEVVGGDVFWINEAGVRNQLN